MPIERRVKIGDYCGVPRYINHVRDEQRFPGPLPGAPYVGERRVFIVGMDGDCTRDVPGDARFYSGYYGDREQVLVFDTHTDNEESVIRRNRDEERRIMNGILAAQQRSRENPS